MQIPSPDPVANWYLEGFVDSGHKAWRTVIRRLPMRIGRRSDSDLHLISDKVSHEHAEIFTGDQGLLVRDLDSTNGTFVNGERLAGERRLAAGDVVRFADLEFRLTRYEVPDTDVDTRTKVLSDTDLSDFLSEQTEEFARLLRARAVRALFQPVIRLADGETVGYELLSRGDLQGFETAPVELFFIAERLGVEAELSRVFRAQGVVAAERLPGRPLVFVNTHPSEIQDRAAFLGSLAELRRRSTVQLVVEIHEAAMTDAGIMKELASALQDMGIGLAFDDFGTGQSRLLEIAEVPPGYVKFDMGFIRGLDAAAPRRRQLVRDLVQLTRSLGVEPVAEGIETRQELEACREAGFGSAQGYFLGLPRPASAPVPPGRAS